MATAVVRGGAAAGASGQAGAQPRRAALVLTALILVAAVANLNLTVANVVLPDIGRAFDAGQTTLDMIAIGYSLGLAGQQYLQDVLGYSALGSGLAVLPAAVCLVGFAPLSARLVHTRGSGFTLLTGYTFCLLSFLTMLLLWREQSGYWAVGLAFVFLGTGVGLAGTPASHSLTGSVPTRRAGMASGPADLQRDLGGAIMQSVLGALLTAGYAVAVATSIAAAPNRQQITSSVQNQLEKSFAGAQAVAQRYPQYASKITAAAKSAFLSGDQWAYTAAIVAVLLGAGLVFFLFPRRVAEERLLARYHAEDSAAAVHLSASASPSPGPRRPPRPAPILVIMA